MQTPTTYRVAARILFTAAISQQRKLARLKDAERWSLTTLRVKLVKIGAKIIRHGRYVTFQMAEVAVPKELFQEILRLIAELRPTPT